MTPSPDQAETLEQALEPCPFCGMSLVKNETFSARSRECFVHPTPELITYELCPVIGVRIWSDNPDRIAAWNRREPAQALAAHRAASPPREGEWVLVPREPTEAMLKASPIVGTGPNEHGDWAVNTKPAQIVWAAMIAASPPPPEVKSNSSGTLTGSVSEEVVEAWARIIDPSAWRPDNDLRQVFEPHRIGQVRAKRRATALSKARQIAALTSESGEG